MVTKPNKVNLKKGEEEAEAFRFREPKTDLGNKAIPTFMKSRSIRTNGL